MGSRRRHHSFQFCEQPVLNLGIVENVEECYHVCYSRGIITGRYHCQNLIAEALLAWYMVSFLGKRDKKSFHKSGEAGSFSVVGIRDIFIDSAGCELESIRI